MMTRRILSLVFNMVASGMTLFTSFIIGLLFLLFVIEDNNVTSALGGLAFLPFAIFGALVIMNIINIINFVRFKNGQYNSLDRFSIGLGILNVLCYIVITILYIGGSLQYIKYFNYGFVFIIICVCFILSIATVVLSIISLRKEAAQYPNA